MLLIGRVNRRKNIGVTLLMVILALIHSLSGLTPLRGASGAILIAGVLVMLLATLGHEVMRTENT